MPQPKRVQRLKSLRFKTLAWLLLLLLGVGIVTFVAGYHLMDRSLQTYEQSMASERLARITQGIGLSLKAMQSAATDYAQWDESYDYMQTPNLDYLERNYYASALENIAADFVLFVNDQGTLVSYVDGRQQEPLFDLPPSPGLTDALTPFKTHAAKLKAANGYYLTTLDGTAFAISYAAIRPSDDTLAAPHVGWLLMARLLNNKGLEQLRQLTGTHLEIVTNQDNPSTSIPTGYLIAKLQDSLGTSPIAVAVDPPPSLNEQRATSQKMLAWNTVLMMVVASLLTVFLLDRMILQRLGIFSRLAEAHQEREDDGVMSWPVRGSDELDTLATSLNNMVDSLQDAKRKLREDQVELLAIQQRLESANRLKDSFLATISHELRTPMNGIVGAQELLKSTPTTPYQRECLDTLSDSSTLMSSMVERILLFSELQSGTVKLKPQVVHLAQWAERMQKVWASIFNDKPIDFRVECDARAASHVSMDIIKLDQFVQELLRNAEKFTQRGQVTLALSEVEVDSRWFLVVDVKDTGIGIPRHQQEAVRDMFRQTAARYTRSHGGLGIGLAITREVIRVLDGEWQLTSEEGQGTHIQARIPIALAEAPALPDATPELPAPTTARSSGPGRILLVEDNPVNQKIMIKILEMLGWSYQLAVNGQEAVEHAQRESFSIILMDCQMPVMDGLEATRIIRQTGNRNQFTPIIAITANVSDLDRDNCMSVGMNAYLPKPVKPQHIHDAIRHWAATDPATTKAG